MRGEQARVDGGHDGQEGNGFLHRVWVREEGGSQTIPDCGRVEGELELDWLIILQHGEGIIRAKGYLAME